jgi:hypothetical protein
VSAAAGIIVRRKRLIRRFREQGASSPDRALPFADVGVRRSWVFDSMVSRGVFLPVGEDRYYMNEQATGESLHAQRRRARVVTAILFVGFMIVMLMSVRC